MSEDGLGWIAEVVIAVVSIATKIIQRKHAKKKAKQAQAAAAALVAETAKVQADIDAAKKAGSPIFGAGVPSGPLSGSTLAVVALGAAGLYFLTRKARR